jgi:hypothetical protein
MPTMTKLLGITALVLAGIALALFWVAFDPYSPYFLSGSVLGIGGAIILHIFALWTL